MRGLQCAMLDLFQFRKDSCTIAASSRLWWYPRERGRESEREGEREVRSSRWCLNADRRLQRGQRERGGGGESRGYCAQWPRQLHSSVKKTKQVCKSQIVNPKENKPSDLLSRMWFSFLEVKLFFFFFFCVPLFFFFKDHNTERQRVGEVPYWEAWWWSSLSTGCRVTVCLNIFKRDRKRRRSLRFVGCTRSRSWHHGLWLNCEVKKGGF